MTDEKTIKDVIYEETFKSLDHATWGNATDGYVNLDDLLTPDGEKTIAVGIQNVADLSDGVATDIIEKIEPFIKEYERLKSREQLAHELIEALKGFVSAYKKDDTNTLNGIK